MRVIVGTGEAFGTGAGAGTLFLGFRRKLRANRDKKQQILCHYTAALVRYKHFPITAPGICPQVE
jgi:hypothetical protein